MGVVTFLRSNILYIVWFLLYFSIAWFILGANLNSLIIVTVIYTISIGVALSPIGEMLLRLLENCREPATEEELRYLMPLFEEAYQSAKEINPKINDGIKLYIMDAMYVNAFAIGRQTVAVTRGAMETFTADELKGILAHELGHMNYGHTKALLLAFIGNIFFSIIVMFFRLILYIIQFISSVIAHLNNFNIVVVVFALLAFMMRVFVNISVFLFINVSQMILALNSRVNETQADTFAYEMGYGKELISGLYVLQKISLNTHVKLIDQMKATHPHTALRIAHLERLENEGLEE